MARTSILPSASAARPLPTTATAALVMAMVAATLATVSTGACVSGPKATDAPAASPTKYPRRRPGCDLTLYHTPVPGVSAWDDLGVAEAACHISGSNTECMRLLKAEACRMGGDILYNVPRQPYRPRDQVLLYRGQVAHTRGAAVVKKEDDPDAPPPASADEAAGPVVPLPKAPPDAAPAPSEGKVAPAEKVPPASP